MDMTIFPVDHRSDSGRDGNGRFASTPGNIGRPRGTRNKVSRNALAGVQALAPSAIAKLANLIEAGEMQAIKLVLEYTLPRGGRALELDASDPDAVTNAIVDGDISPDEGDRVASAFGKLAGLRDLETLRQRLDELEAAVRK
jgi:hypothetical protein